MEHESFIKEITIEESELSFEKIYNKPWFPTEVADEVKNANFLIIPTDYNNDGLDVLFPETTSEFYNYIIENSNENVICDIAISEDNFRKIEKHSALIEVATVIVSSGLLPIAINMISSYLYDLVVQYRRTPDNTSAKVKIIVEEKKNKKTVKIKYTGPVSEIKETMEKTIDNVFK